MKAVIETAFGSVIENQDRGAIIETSFGLVLIVADGMGGLGGGKAVAASTMAVGLVREAANELHDPKSCLALLQRMDKAVDEDKIAGETTCALAIVTESAVHGASVGDSGVWVINESGFINLTVRQSRMPLIGSGLADPIPFYHTRTGKEFVLLATDGLLKYTSPERIMTTCRESAPPAEIVRHLIELVRYKSGALPDDVTVIFASPES
jgi:serine/threonine protein phosphatase PrpC